MRKVSLLLFLFILSCKKEEKIISKPIILEVKKEKKVDEILSELSKKDTIDYLDLSNKKLDSLPDLSSYNIKSLDLSFNNLDTIPLSRLPLTLKKFNASNNNLKAFISNNYKNHYIKEFNKYDNSNLNLEELNLSNNNLTIVVINFNEEKQLRKSSLRKVDVSNNKLEHINFSGNLDYLDVSNNLDLPSEVLFGVDKIDTLLQNNNPNKLKTKRIPPLPPIICKF